MVRRYRRSSVVRRKAAASVVARIGIAKLLYEIDYVAEASGEPPGLTQICE